MTTQIAKAMAIIVSTLVASCCLSVLAGESAVQNGSLGPLDRDSGCDYVSGCVTARSDFVSAPGWSSFSEKHQEKAIPNWRLSSPSGPDKARLVLENAKAKKILARCRALGMFELPELAFALAKPGEGAQDNFFVIPMSNPRGNRFSSAMLFGEQDGSVISITVDTATNELLDVILPEDDPGGDQEMLKFNKKKWADCFTTACGPCIAGCAFTGPLWLKCSAACCGVAAAVCVYVALHD